METSSMQVFDLHKLIYALICLLVLPWERFCWVQKTAIGIPSIFAVIVNWRTWQHTNQCVCSSNWKGKFCFFIPSQKFLRVTSRANVILYKYWMLTLSMLPMFIVFPSQRWMKVRPDRAMGHNLISAQTGPRVYAFLAG